MPDAAPSFARRSLIAGATALLVAATAFLLWRLGRVLLVLFAAILIGVGIDALARFFQGYTRLPRALCLALSFLSIALFFFLLSLYLAPVLAQQVDRLATILPEALEDLRSWLAQYGWGRALLAQAPTPGALVSDSEVLGRLTGAFSSAVAGLVDVLVVLLVGAYLPIHGPIYRKAVLRLLPPHRRQRGDQVLAAVGHGLRRWLVARFASMLLVGVLATVGYWIVGIPLAVALGVLAGILAFIPYLGAVLSVIPALLVAVPEGAGKVVAVALVYAAVQTLESGFITPLIEKRAVYLPPAFTLSMQVVMGFLAGAIGVILATPLAVVLVVVIQTLYIENVLGERITLLGD